MTVRPIYFVYCEPVSGEASVSSAGPGLKSACESKSAFWSDCFTERWAGRAGAGEITSVLLVLVVSGRFVGRLKCALLWGLGVAARVS